MTTRSVPVTPGRRIVSLAGTVLVALPLVAGLVAALSAVGGRFGGGSSAFTALWYVAAAAAPVALVGAVLLVIAHWRREALRSILTWSLVGVGGWVFGMGSAQATGLAAGPEEAQQPWQLALVGIGVGAYLVGLVGLARSGWLASRPAGQGAAGRGPERDPERIEDVRRVAVVLSAMIAALYVVVFLAQLPHLREPDNPAPVYAMLAAAYLVGTLVLALLRREWVCWVGAVAQVVLVGLFVYLALELRAHGDLQFLLDMSMVAGVITAAQVILAGLLAYLGAKLHPWRGPRPTIIGPADGGARSG